MVGLLQIAGLADNPEGLGLVELVKQLMAKSTMCLCLSVAQFPLCLAVRDALGRGGEPRVIGLGATILLRCYAWTA
jgi:hypothetical protein